MSAPHLMIRVYYIIMHGSLGGSAWKGDPKTNTGGLKLLPNDFWPTLKSSVVESQFLNLKSNLKCLAEPGTHLKVSRLKIPCP